MASIGPQTIGRYRLEERIGTGGMAEIYLARYAAGTDLDPYCVVKRLLPELAGDPEMVELFLDEARINLLLDHPNVVSVFDAGRDGDDVFLAMEYVNGRDLRWMLSALQRAGTRVPPEVALQIAAELLQGLWHAHRARDARGRALRLVHRDISPENVLISRAGQVKLTDFGAARSTVSRSRHGRETLVGKLGYLAPECLEQGQATASSDLFSVGLVLFEMLTGAALHAAESPRLVWTFWQQFEPTAVIPRMVPLGEGGAILVKALETDPRRRYRDAEAFLQDVQDQLFRRGKGVSDRALGEFIEDLEGSGTERGRATTAPIELPVLDSGRGRPVAGASSEEETLEQSAMEAEPLHLFAGGQAHGPLGDATSRLVVEEHGVGDAVVCRGHRHWVPAASRWAELAVRDGGGAPPRRLPCAELGPDLLRSGGGGLERRITWWLQQQLVSVHLQAGRIVRAVHYCPSMGPAVELDLQVGVRAGARAGLLEPEQRLELRRRELRRFLTLPLRWDEMWSQVTALGPGGPEPRGGVGVLVALADAARAVPDDERITDLVSAFAARGLAAHPQRQAVARAAELWRTEIDLLDRIHAGEQLPDFLRRYQVDPRRVFRTLFVLIQTGLVTSIRPAGSS